ncbi:MAG: hypothetical protein A2622_07335 [Bdellovibrionales bacterium RIFCSPHIGHO2_01_FULL_40_29]|nr:MAG: hypothetical protein A2622_07335 [Bdellovibrionales bacterium RIFCSPHIGHO2_01_FULL_40_29]OFZ33192.1 MAG: hypothetical protein A3D17_11445 [Bdellovibrionales bacterium RIFCSPHIGHO2_02_FULL_40_15]
MKIIILIASLLYCQFSFSLGEPDYNTWGCIEAKLSTENIELNEKYCTAYFVEIKNNKKWRSATRICPLASKRKFIFIATTGVVSPYFDEVEITNKKSCDIKYVDGVHIYREPKDFTGYKIKDLPKGTPLKELTKLNFFKIRSTGSIWTYHLTPGISADVEITGEMCGKEICLDEKKQKISKVLKIYKDFIMMDDKDQIYYSSALDPIEKYGN